MAILYNAEWYAKHQNLCNEGIEIKSLTSRDISKANLDLFFGPKIDKNGWRYSGKQTRKEARKIESLYHKVTSKDKIVNSQLIATLARSMFAEFRGTIVNWANFVATLSQHIRDTKATSMEQYKTSQPLVIPQRSVARLQRYLSL